MLFFFTYGHVFGLLHNIPAAGVLGKNRYLGILWAGLWLAGAWLFARKIKSPMKWTGPLDLFAGVLVVFSLFQLGTYEVSTYLASRDAETSRSSSIASQLRPPAGKELPDIYYFIPEDYTRADGLQQVFGFDNSTFLSALAQRGFYVATCSQANYGTSDASIASSLNMNFLDQLSPQFSPPNPDLQTIYPYIQNNAVLETLKDLGYKFVSFQSGYSPTEFRGADDYLSSQTDPRAVQLWGGLTSFESIFFQTTALDFFYQTRLFPAGLQNTLFNNAYLLERDRILYELDGAGAVPSLPGPKFVFIHLLGPHNPFVFGPHGEILHRSTPFTLNDDRDAVDFNSYKAGYTGEIQYLNTRLLADIDEILAKSSTPPIILLQSDTGSDRALGWALAELNAYYLPEGGSAHLYPSISPVNSFRVVFNTYFGGTLPLLPDRICASSRNNPFGCTIQVDPNPNCIKP